MALQDYEDLIGLNFDWLALDGSLHKAALSGKSVARQLDLDTFVPAVFRAMQPFCNYLQHAIDA